MSRLTMGVVVGLSLTACAPRGDLNSQCSLIKKGPDGGRALVTEAEVRADQDKDFLSLGYGSGCDFPHCVRDSEMVSNAGLNTPALGYCSRPCQPNDPCPSFDPAMDTGPDRLTCRALLLNAETLAQTHLAGVTDPYFCARGGRDGG